MDLAWGVCFLFVVVVVGLCLAIVVSRALLPQPAARGPARLDRDNGPRPWQPAAAAAPQATEPLPGRCPVCGVELPGDCPLGLCPQCLLQCALSNSDHALEQGDEAGTAAYQRPSTAPPVAEIASLFSQLEILELIGQGGMGAVYKARQTKLDRLVAVKILPQEWGRDPAFSERFAREARALARLNHPNIVGVHDFGEAGGLFYLVMEFVDGANLRQVLHSGRLHPQQALVIVPQICDALQYAHEEGIVHRDIKPENILLDKRGQVKIADFGLAKLTRRSGAPFTLTGSQQVMGTLDYMAPEQRTTPQEVDHRADIYALGVVFYEMLTGELPLGRFAPPSEKAAVDKRLDEVVFRALEREPARRYQRISEVRTAVESVARVTPGVSAALGRRGRADPGSEPLPIDVRGPAVGLILTAGLFFLHAVIVGLSFNYDLLQRGQLTLVVWLFFAVVYVVVTALTGIMIAGALQLWAVGSARRDIGSISGAAIGSALQNAGLSSYRLVLTAVILAMLPLSIHFLIGLPVGLWALWVLTRPEVKAAFARNMRQGTGPAGGHRPRMAPPAPRKPTGPILGMVKSALHAMLTLIVHRPTAVSSVAEAEAGPEVQEGEKSAAVPGALHAHADAATPVHQARKTDRELGSPSSGRRRGPLWKFVVLSLVIGVVLGLGLILGFTMARRDNRDYSRGTYTEESPPSDEAALAFHRCKIGLLASGDQARQANAILRTADEEYLKIEARHTERALVENGIVTITVLPFQEELKTLEDRVWSQLATVFVYDYQLRRVKQLLPMRGSLFPFGTDAITIQIRNERNGWFHWRVSKPGDPAKGQWNYGAELPPEYRRFWGGDWSAFGAQK
jgi:tRNA A-37 threonylcarbamoyl transferase component Bud32